MKKNLFRSVALLSLVVFMGILTACEKKTEPSASNTQASQESQIKQETNVQKESEEIAVMETSVGTIVLQFFPDVAPGHVDNFKKLAREGFYDGTRFHRVIKGFMIQGGDPNTKGDDINTWGRGGPGYSIKAEFNNKQHVKGTLSMARSSDPNSAGSQFFLCDGRAEHLDHQYTAFGEVMDGMDVLDKIASAPVRSSPSGENSLPITPVTVKSVKIIPPSEYKKKS